MMRHQQASVQHSTTTSGTQHHQRTDSRDDYLLGERVVLIERREEVLAEAWRTRCVLQSGRHNTKHTNIHSTHQQAYRDVAWPPLLSQQRAVQHAALPLRSRFRWLRQPPVHTCVITCNVYDTAHHKPSSWHQLIAIAFSLLLSTH
jgi:hypothetical protein